MMMTMEMKYKYMMSCKSSSSSKSSVRKGSWTREEDELLKRCVERHGEGKWNLVPGRAGLNRCRKSCRLRWFNYLRPNIKRGHFSNDEIDLILRLHKLLGNRWALIAGRIPGRTGNDIKNYWNSRLSKNLISEGKLLSTTAANPLSDYHDHIDTQPSAALDSAEYLEVSSGIGCNKLVVEQQQQQPLSSKGQEEDEEVGESLSFWKNLLFIGEELEARMSFQKNNEELILNIDGDHLDFSLDDLFKDIEMCYDRQMMPPH